RPKYATLGFGGDSEKATVTGDTAKATITVTNADDGSVVGEVEWEFVKEGETWKIKSAPLP
ncbi:MAG TPA: hypothetical protein VE890_15320, partial [Thermoguttaceae bacterium]|nr:hypothetical protein [Thermoguttaceae bacterium]